MAEEPQTTSLKSAFEWALKIGPILGTIILFVFTLYSNQATMIKHDADVDKKLTDIDTAMNKENRELVERLAKADATVDELRHDLEFYIKTTQHGNK